MNRNQGDTRAPVTARSHTPEGLKAKADSPPYPGAPRWAKVLGIIGASALVVAGILQHTLEGGMGGH